MTKLIAVIFATSALCAAAQADNSLSSAQLIQSIQNSVQDYSANQPDMAKSISGLRTTTVSSIAEVTIEMNADGMSMSAKYVCAPQGSNMACNLQQ